MKTISKTILLFAIIVIFLFSLAAYSYGDREFGLSRPPSFKGEGAGYELINLVGRDVWATRDWTPEAYEKFSFPVSWIFWRKNDPRIALADRGRLLKSPGCEDGHYNYMRAFGREFVQVVRLISIYNRIDELDLIRKTELEKYHALHYGAGRTVSILQSPDGERFIGVSKSLERSSDSPTLPKGWTITEHLLKEEIQVELLGKISVLRMSNEDSYQGPISQKIPQGNGPMVR
ncbi:MAG: hypothetical protein K9N10_22705 [Deltaproteobacteria bacterium]|nr:hypothetical protein [Deltaproteobacteria bacterium]